MADVLREANRIIAKYFPDDPANACRAQSAVQEILAQQPAQGDKVPGYFQTGVLTTPAKPAQGEAVCRKDGRCQYAIDHGAEGLGHCPKGKCAMPAQGEAVWRDFPEQVPDPDTECLVEVAFNGGRFRAVDTWEMQSEAPVEWSSATVEVGYDWSSHPGDVQRWIPISSITAPPAPSVPDGWREFIAECATSAGKMVNGNRLSERAAGLLASGGKASVPGGWGLAAFQHKWEACETQCECKVCGTVFTAAPEVKP